MFENFNLKYKLFSKKIKRKVDLRGYLILRVGNQSRHYFWGEGQNYTNNIEFFFNNSSIYAERFFSKLKNEPTYIKIFENNKVNKLFKNFKYQ